MRTFASVSVTERPITPNRRMSHVLQHNQTLLFSCDLFSLKTFQILKGKAFLCDQKCSLRCLNLLKTDRQQMQKAKEEKTQFGHFAWFLCSMQERKQLKRSVFVTVEGPSPLGLRGTSSFALVCPLKSWLCCCFSRPVNSRTFQ